MLPVRLLERTPVSHEPLHGLPVHQRFAAEEIDLEIPAGAGSGHQEVQGLLSGLEAHQLPAAVVLALLGEAVAAGEVAVVGNVKAQRLHDRPAVLERLEALLIFVRGEQLARVNQLFDIVDRLVQVILAVRGDQCRDGPLPELRPVRDAGLVKAAVDRDRVINDVVHDVNGAAADVHHDVLLHLSVLVYHVLSFKGIRGISC